MADKLLKLVGGEIETVSSPVFEMVTLIGLIFEEVDSLPSAATKGKIIKLRTNGRLYLGTRQ